MLRICNSLAVNGYTVTFVGAETGKSSTLLPGNFQKKRIRLVYTSGPWFYMEYNLRLFFYLLFRKCDCICCIDLDTIMPVHFAAMLRGRKKVYDAHEYFSQQKEIISRPQVHRVWHWIERTFLPKFKNGYTVSQSIADEFYRLYAVRYAVIRNLPVFKDHIPAHGGEKFILYQGAVNEARGLESLVPAMKEVNAQLHIYGDGNYMAQTKELIASHGLQDKVILKGKFLPEELNNITASAYIGINLVENNGLNQYYSLANKFFDYILYRVPQVTMNFPEYAAINNKYEVALLIDEISPGSVAGAINELLNNDTLHERLAFNCIAAAAELNWNNEEKKLLNFYKAIFE